MTQAPLGVLLAGGEAVRTGGRPKGLFVLAPGRRVLDAPLAALQATCGQVVVDSADPRVLGALPDLEAILDGTRGIGALGAIRTALAAGAARGADIVLACAWDMPGVSPSLLATLVAMLAADDTADVALPRHAGTLDPLCAAWRTRVLAACDAAIADGTRAAHRWIATVAARPLEGAPLAALGEPERLLMNVNTDDDLAIAARLFAS